MGQHRRRQPRGHGGGPRAGDARRRHRRARAGHAVAQPRGPHRARPPVLRRRGDVPPRAARRPAVGRGLRDRPRRARAGAHPRPARPRPVPRRLARRAADPGAPRPPRRRRRADRGAPRRAARARPRRASPWHPRARHDPRPRGGRRPVRRRPALRAPGDHRAHRLRAKATRFRHNLAADGHAPGADRPDPHADRPARAQRQGARDDRGRRRGRPAAHDRVRVALAVVVVRRAGSGARMPVRSPGPWRPPAPDRAAPSGRRDARGAGFQRNPAPRHTDQVRPGRGAAPSRAPRRGRCRHRSRGPCSWSTRPPPRR